MDVSDNLHLVKIDVSTLNTDVGVLNSLIKNENVPSGKTKIVGINSNVDISASSTTIMGDLQVDGGLTVDGSLHVKGTTTTIHSSVLDISDHNIHLSNGGSSSSNTTADGAGLTVEAGNDGDKTFTWENNANYKAWTSNDHMDLSGNDKKYLINEQPVVELSGNNTIFHSEGGNLYLTIRDSQSNQISNISINEDETIIENKVIGL